MGQPRRVYELHFVKTSQIVYEDDRKNSSKPSTEYVARDFIRYAEDRILKYNHSTDVPCELTRRTHLFEVQICTKRIFNWIYEEIDNTYMKMRLNLRGIGNYVSRQIDLLTLA